MPPLSQDKRPRSLAQVTLEFTLCFVVLLIIFLAGFLAFKWGGKTMSSRQQDYEGSRIEPLTSQGKPKLYTTPGMKIIVGYNRNP